MGDGLWYPSLWVSYLLTVVYDVVQFYFGFPEFYFYWRYDPLILL